MRRILIIYDSLTGNTERMAEYIAEGAKTVIKNVIIKNINDVEFYEIAEARAIALGCPTYYRALTDNMKNFLGKVAVEAKDSFQGKIGVAFGAYGWSGDSIKLMKETMKYFKMKVIKIEQDTTGTPDQTLYLTALSEIKEKTIDLGKQIAKQIVKMDKSASSQK